MRRRQLYLFVILLNVYSGGTSDFSSWSKSASKLGLKCESSYSTGGQIMTCMETSNSEPAFTIKFASNAVGIECQASTPYNLFADAVSLDVEYIRVIQCTTPNVPFSHIFKNKNLQTLEFSRTLNSTALNSYLFQDLRLENLILPDNRLTALNESLFKTLSNLNSLILSNNSLETITPNLFISLKNLYALKLDRNNIKNLSKSAFSGLSKLKELFLSENIIESLPEEIFADLHSLKHLYVSHNYLAELPPAIFDNLPSLTYLDMNSNNLTYLPETLLQNSTRLQELNIANNPLESLPENLLTGLVMFVNISIQNCNLLRLPGKFFQPAVNLERIEMWNNRLSILPPGLIGQMKNLTHLYLSFNDVTSLANFPFSKNIRLTHLDMKKNNLKEIPKGAFDNLSSLTELNLSDNFITSIERNAFDLLTKLKRLNLANNQIALFSQSQPFSLSSTIGTIDISGNQLTSFPAVNWPFYSSLKKLKVNNNRIKNFTVPILNFSANVSLQSNEITTVNFSLSFINNYKNNYLSDKPLFYLGNNSFKCDCNLWEFVSFLRGSSNMALVAMFPDVNELRCFEPSDVKEQIVLKVDESKFICGIIENCPTLCSCYFRSFDDKIVVNCSSRSFTEFPDIAPRNTSILYLENNNLTSLKDLAHPVWNNLTALYVDHNNIVSEDWYIPPNLTLLSLQYNRLSSLPNAVTDHLANNRNFRLKLSRNDWMCNCWIVSFKEWLTEQRIVDIQNVSCVQTSTGKNISALKLYQLIAERESDFCPSSNLIQKILISVAVSSAFLIGICIALVMYYRNKQTVIAYVYIHFYSVFMCFYKEKEIDEDKIFDAFVSYSSSDRDVALALLQGLENKEPFYKLCIHERDWVAGNLISWNIADSVLNSRKTILILSSDFLQSIWFQVEFHTAYYQMLQDKIDRFIVVVKGELPPRETLDKDLQFLLSTKTYLTWGERWFWEKLRFAMPHRKTSPTVFDRLPLHGRVKQSLIKTIEDEISLVTKDS